MKKEKEEEKTLFQPCYFDVGKRDRDTETERGEREKQSIIERVIFIGERMCVYIHDEKVV